jgi:hypothetical protein
VQFCIAQLARGVLADGFEHGNDVELFALGQLAGGRIGQAPGQDRAAINEHGGAVHTRHGDHRAGHVFVATADGDVAVHAAATHDGFNRVSDDFAGDERVFHRLVAVRNAVGHGDGVEDDGLAAAGVRAFLGFERELVDVHVARRDVGPSGRDADERLLEIFLGEADGIQHGAGGGAVRAVEERAGKGADVDGFFSGGFLFHRRESLAETASHSSRERE